MPNYMRVRVTMKGIAKLPFYDEWGDLDFDKVIPTPKELTKNKNEDGFLPWSDVVALNNWRRKHWGTSSSSWRLLVVTSKRIVFETAWHPPIGLFLEVSRLYPEHGIFIEWADEFISNHYAGCAKISKGELVGRINYTTPRTCKWKWKQLWRYRLPYDKYQAKSEGKEEPKK